MSGRGDAALGGTVSASIGTVSNGSGAMAGTSVGSEEGPQWPAELAARE